MAALKSRRSFMSRLPLSSSHGKSLSRQGFSATAARHLGDIQVTVQNAPSAPKAPRTSVSRRGPVELPEQYTSPYSGLGVSFGTPQDVEMSAATSEGEPGGEADDSADRYPSAVAAPLRMLNCRLCSSEPPRRSVWRCPKHLRPIPLGWMIGGYEAVPQVERAVAVHVCPCGAATWRDRPHLLSRACKFSSALAGRAYHAAGHAATALHAMATLQVYQAKATKVTARSLGQVMSTIVVQERHLWLTLAQMADVDKSRFLDAPISQSGLFGDTVEDFAQQLSAVQKQTEAIKHILPRRDVTFHPRPRGPHLHLLVAEGTLPRPQRNNQLRPLLRCTTPDWQPDVELPAGEGRRPRLRDRSPAKDLRSVPDAGNPEVERIALWGATTSTSPLPVEGRGLLCAQTLPSAYGSAVPTRSQKEPIFSPPGFRPRVPSLSSAQEVSPRTRSLMSPAREPGKKVSTAQCSLTFLQDVLPSGISPLPLPPPGCPTAATSVNVPLIPLATRLGAWLQLPSPSRWLIRTVRFGYAIQFARRPPRYRGVLSTSVHSDTHAAVLRAEVAVLLAKDAIEPVPPAEMMSGFYSPYFIVPKKSGGLRPILDLRALNRSLLRLPFKMLTTKRMLTCIRPQDWFAAIDLKDAYFHVSILPRHRPFLWFAFEGRAYQYKTGIRILNYLDDWLLIAHSRDLLCEQRDLVLRHLSHLGLQVNREKSKLSPVQRISFLGVELDSVKAPGAYGSRSRSDAARPASYETASALVTRLSPEMGMAPWHTPDWRFPAVSPPVQPVAGVPLGQVSRHLVVYTDASSTGWGAVCNGQAASGSWTGPRLQWHINCLELLAVLLALCRFRPTLRHKHVLVRTDSTATVAYINRQGGLRSHRMSQLARHLLLWSQTWLKSLRAVHIPGELNRAADQLSRQSTHPGEWRLHPETVQLIWSHFGGGPDRSVCFPRILPLPAVLLPQRGSQQPRQGCTGTQLASGAQVRLSPSEPLCTDTVQDQGGRGAGSAGCAILAHPDLVSRTHFPHGSPSLENPLEERPSFSGDGHNLAPAPRPVEPARLVPGRDASDLSGLPQAVIETITQSRAPSTRQAYALRWGLFVDWCSSRGEDPQRCTIAVVLSFLQEKLERRLSPSTLKVYVAAIAAYHDAVDGTSLGKHQLIGLREAPFEPLASVELKYLSLKTALLTVLASIKRVGDLQAFSFDEACLEFGPGDSHVILRPRPGYVPKVPTTPFRDQVVNLQALPLEEADQPLRCCVQFALCVYTWTALGTSDAPSSSSSALERLAHWVVDAISLSYQNQGEPCPLGVRAHSTRSVASSYALAHGASLADISRAADITGEREPGWCRLAAPFLMDPCAISLSCSLRRTWVLHAPQSGLVRSSACLCSGWVSFAQQRFHVLRPPQLLLQYNWHPCGAPYWPPGRWEGYAHIRLLTRPPVGTRCVA
ncbi:Transposon Ty3-G Gag-Pol polyprotein [Labeo rohita]|uniref:ribonuclease H n=1 Tax=Labeo rohita TaxID=84645 RepID=A0ABQ8LBG8_LABRO|nr:Transposon Ty3-G Gag-Pol polyprotein [Labeo rohita]